MNSHLSTRPALSLQEKLDRIAHDRDVLALQRQLAERGLREGDTVLPRLRVLAEDGTAAEFSPSRWRRATVP